MSLTECTPKIFQIGSGYFRRDLCKFENADSLDVGDFDDVCNDHAGSVHGGKQCEESGKVGSFALKEILS